MENPGDAAGAIFMVFFMVFYVGIILMSLASFVVWIVALVDVVRREFKDPNEKLIWVLVVALAHGIGGIIYLVAGRKKGTMPGEPSPPP